MATTQEQSDTRSKFMTLAELADELGITAQTASRYAERGALPVRSFRLGRQWRFSRADVERLASGDAEPVHVEGKEG